MSHILVVSNDRPGLAGMLTVLNEAGYRASGACTFEEAKRFLAVRSPDFVIADGRLGAFNGLHVILRARAEHPDIGAIVTTPVTDRGLEADARGLNIECVVKPQNAADWLPQISRRLEIDSAAGSSTISCEAIHAHD